MPEKTYGTFIDTQPIAEEVRDPLPQKYLIVDNLSGDGGGNILDRIEDDGFKHADAVEAKTLQEAFNKIRPELRVEVPIPGDTGDSKPVRLVFKKLEDFDADRLIRQIPQLNELEELEQGMRLLLKFLGTKAGHKVVADLEGNPDAAGKMQQIARAYYQWLADLKRVVNEQREE